MATGLFPSREGRGGPRKGYMPKNRRPSRAQMNALADCLAEGAPSIADAARQLGMAERTANRLFHQIRAQLGWQAV
jgi:hypothetical protein